MKSSALLLSLFAVSVLAACGEESVSPIGSGGGSDGSGAAGGGDVTSSGGSNGSGGSGGGVVIPNERATIEGDATWTVTFDDVAKAAGAIDCSYTRHYVGVEDESAPWFCPDCEVVFRTDVEMTAGQTDCYSQLSTDPPLTEEWIGYGNGRYYRGYFLMSDQGTGDVVGDALTVANVVMDQDAPVGGKLQFDVAGGFTLGTGTGDPLNGFRAPSTYTCGWPKANPPEYTGDYTADDGKTLPDGVFYDKCEQPVRLHDFKGKYLVVDMSARDCPPCQSMGSQENDFIASLAADGIEVEVITLLAPSLSDTLGTTTTAMLNSWTNKYELTSPVLADRGLGLSMFIPLFGDTVGYPSMLIVDPNLKIITGMSGFDDYTTPKQAIKADAGQ
jgi:hypothetical protein